MKLTLIIIGLFSVLGAFIPRIKKDYWWIRGFEFPHAQFTFLSLATTITFCFFINWTFYDVVFLLLMLTTIVYQLVILVPYTILWKKQVKSCGVSIPENKISVLSANIYMYNNDSTKLKSLIKKNNPDIISLLEPNEVWRQDMEYLKKDYPFYIEKPQEDTYGMLLYSKFPFFKTHVHYLVEDNVPSIHAVIKLNNDIKVNIHCLHPKPPSPTQNKKSTERDVELLLVAKEVEKNNNPTIVMGDLNDVAWSTTTRNFQKISGLLDPRIGRGFFNTFHVKFPFLRWPLDHFFNSHHFTLINIKRLKNIGSDHFPIYMQLHFESKNRNTKIPSADDSITELAEKKINKVIEGKQPKINLD